MTETKASGRIDEVRMGLFNWRIMGYEDDQVVEFGGRFLTRRRAKKVRFIVYRAFIEGVMKGCSVMAASMREHGFEVDIEVDDGTD